MFIIYFVTICIIVYMYTDMYTPYIHISFLSSVYSSMVVYFLYNVTHFLLLFLLLNVVMTTQQRQLKRHDTKKQERESNNNAKCEYVCRIMLSNAY